MGFPPGGKDLASHVHAHLPATGANRLYLAGSL